MKINTYNSESGSVTAQFTVSIDGTVNINYLDVSSVDMDPQMDSYALVTMTREEAVAHLHNLEYILSLGGPIA